MAFFGAQQYTPFATFLATDDESAKQFCVVKLSSTVGSVTLSTATSDLIIGIMTDAPKAGDTGKVALLGSGLIVSAIAGGTLAVGDLLTVDSSSRVVKATQTTAGSQPVIQLVGRALEVAATNDRIAIQLSASFLY